MSGSIRPAWHHVLALELCLCCAVIGLVLGLCLRLTPAWVDKARGVERFFQAHDARHAWIERIAETGEPPAAPPLPLDLRPAWSASEPAANLMWVCGDRRPPAGWHARLAAPGPEATFATTYSACRERPARW